MRGRKIHYQQFSLPFVRLFIAALFENRARTCPDPGDMLERARKEVQGELDGCHSRIYRIERLMEGLEVRAKLCSFFFFESGCARSSRSCVIFARVDHRGVVGFCVGTEDSTRFLYTRRAHHDVAAGSFLQTGRECYLRGVGVLGVGQGEREIKA